MYGEHSKKSDSNLVRSGRYIVIKRNSSNYETLLLRVIENTYERTYDAVVTKSTYMTIDHPNIVDTCHLKFMWCIAVLSKMMMIIVENINNII
jgi:hypothetical protein